MEVIMTSILVIVIVCIGCFVLIRSKDWHKKTVSDWKSKHDQLVETNKQLDQVQETLESITPILEKTNEVFTKLKESQE